MKGKKIRYATSAERIGRKEGKQEGLSPEIIARITGLDTEIIKKIMENEKVDIPLHLL